MDKRRARLICSVTTPIKFSTKTFQFLVKAGRQKNPTWLDRNRVEYEKVLLEPLKNLACELKKDLYRLAPSYNFPQKGIGRIKRSSHYVEERGGALYKNWMTYSASRPRTSRFEHNPNLFFLINTEDCEDPVLVAGGLYMPSSRQTRALREAIAQDASAFDALFAAKDFRRSFPDGFSSERISSRLTRGFEPNHPRMDWLRLQAFFVWRPYTKKEFHSADFPKLVSRDFKQVLRLNELIEKALIGQLPSKAKRESKLSDRFGTVEHFKPKMDF